MIMPGTPVTVISPVSGFHGLSGIARDYPRNGFVAVDLNDADAVPGVRRERLVRATVFQPYELQVDCSACAQTKPGDLAPRHRASDQCQSGKHPHCACDTCF